jgi:hypothetical protein
VSKPKPRTLTVAFVKWFDASYQRDECRDEELNPTVILESAGLLAHEDEKTISLSLDRYEADQVWRYTQHIPKVNVLKIRKWKVPVDG